MEPLKLFLLGLVGFGAYTILNHNGTIQKPVGSGGETIITRMLGNGQVPTSQGYTYSHNPVPRNTYNVNLPKPNFTAIKKTSPVRNNNIPNIFNWKPVTPEISKKAIVVLHKEPNTNKLNDSSRIYSKKSQGSNRIGYYYMLE